ncbi:Squalene epoxidase [Coemansia sp. S155-1]|nr:Squalene epoxidase [Coemansia sp. S155-1]
MTVPEYLPLDENEDWPTHGEYEYTAYYHSRRQVHEFSEQLSPSFDYIVIGAGPIGAALAFKLSTDHPDQQILIVEKSWDEPDRIVGELMQPAGCHALELLGLGRVFSGIGAVPVHGYYIAYGGNQLYVPYPLNPNGKPFRGVSFHHGRLVMNLRAACKSRSNITCLEASVVDLIRDSGISAIRGVRVGAARDNGQKELKEVTARRITFVCDGISSQFRKVLNPEPVALISHFCGLVLEHEPVSTADHFTGPAGAIPASLRADPCTQKENPLPMPHNGHVLLDGLGPVLLYQMSERETRVLADIPGPTLPSDGSQLRALVRESLSRAAPKQMYPVLHSRLMDAVDGTQRLRCIGSKFIPATANRIPGAIWIGDALNVRHPLTGGGMTVGLWDIVHLCKQMAKEDHSPRALNRMTAQWQWDRRSRALVVNTLSVALHALFAAADSPDMCLLRDACFSYLSRGSFYTMHPSGFLSGLFPSPLLLLFHFFSVAILAVTMRLGDPKAGILPIRCLSAARTLWVAACVILPFMWRELQP